MNWLNKNEFDKAIVGGKQIFSSVMVKDPHMCFGFANRIRLRGTKDLEDKLNWINRFLGHFDIDYLIHTGDLTDTNDEKLWTFKQYRLNKEALIKLKTVLPGEKNVPVRTVPIIGPVGNHDMFNGSVDLEETVYNELVKEKVIHNITDAPVEFNHGGKKAVIKGVNFNKDPEVVKADIKAYEEEPGDFKILVFHSHVTPEEESVTDFTYANLIKEFPGIDVFVCGHWHKGFPTEIRKSGGGETGQPEKSHLIINNWSLQRMIRNYYSELDLHKPQLEYFALGWCNARNDFVCTSQTVQIPHAPYLDAFKPKAVDIIKTTLEDKFDFFEKVNLEDIPVGDDDIENIKKLSDAKGHNVSKDVVVKAIEYLDNVKG